MENDRLAIQKWHKRREDRLAKRNVRLDFEVGVFPPDEAGDKGTFHGNTRLPYGLCKAAGIDTTGMTPSEAWAALRGETGITPKKAFKELEEHGTVKGIEPDGDLPGTEELGHEGPIPEPYKPGTPFEPPEKESPEEKNKKYADAAMRRLNSGKHARHEKSIQECLDKLKEIYGDKCKVMLPSNGDYVDVVAYDITNPHLAKRIAQEKQIGPTKITVGKDKEEAEEAFRKEMNRWKESDEYKKVNIAFDYEYNAVLNDRDNGKITVEEGKKRIKEIGKERKKNILRVLPNFDSCNTMDEIKARTSALGNFIHSPEFSDDTDLDNAKELSKSAEHMFDAFPCMKRRVKYISTKETKAGAFAWVNDKVESGIYVDRNYAQNRKKMKNAYEFSMMTGYHPPGTDTDSIVYHEFAHVIDVNLSTYINNHGGIPGYSGKMVSTYIAKQMAKDLGMPVEEMKLKVSKYAAQRYPDNPELNDTEFIAECMAEYVGSSKPRPICVECVKRLTDLLKKTWGEDAVSSTFASKA